MVKTASLKFQVLRLGLRIARSGGCFHSDASDPGDSVAQSLGSRLGCSKLRGTREV